MDAIRRFPAAASFITQLEKLQFLVHQENTKQTTARTALEIYWVYGPTGSGKTFSVSEEVGPNAYWHSASAGEWFCGYEGQTDVVFDDFAKGQIRFSLLLRLMDVNPVTVQRKGREGVPWVPKRIFFTSTQRPEECFAESEERRGQQAFGEARAISKYDVAQLKRRINYMWRVQNDNGTCIVETTETNAPSARVAPTIVKRQLTLAECGVAPVAVENRPPTPQGYGGFVSKYQ